MKAEHFTPQRMTATKSYLMNRWRINPENGSCLQSLMELPIHDRVQRLTEIIDFNLGPCEMVGNIRPMPKLLMSGELLYRFIVDFSRVIDNTPMNDIIRCKGILMYLIIFVRTIVLTQPTLL